ncbi:hypothetical protein CJF31_00008096 [Rutstroemia sp. NJR-2017a BVV2]|nr:hypothetical protein CJF31_00008096 [Rutstroemia sp. NJR-2017a BVV2]
MQESVSDGDDDVESKTTTKRVLRSATRGSTAKATAKDEAKVKQTPEPRMTEKVLLCLQYECLRAGIELPWKKVATRVCPGTSDIAVLQRLVKVRSRMLTEGHLVPPPLHKRPAKGDRKLRGYIRDETKDNPRAVRAVGWGELIDDRDESLTIPGVYWGSGNYRKYVKNFQCRRKTVVKNRRAGGASKAATKAKKPKSGVKKRASSGRALASSEDDYEPTATLRKKSRASRRVQSVDYTSGEAIKSESGCESDAGDYFEQSPSKKRKGPGGRCITPAANLPVKLKLSSELLRKFPPGESRAMGLSQLVEDDHDGSNGWQYPGRDDGQEMMGMMGGGFGDLGEAGTMNRAVPNVGEFDIQSEGLPNYEDPFKDFVPEDPDFSNGEFAGSFDELIADYELNVDELEVDSGNIVPMNLSQDQAEDFTATTPNTSTLDFDTVLIDWNELTNGMSSSDDGNQLSQ